MSAPAYLVSGERFLADEALARIRDEAGTDPLAEDVFEPDVESATLISALDTPSLLGGKRLVVVMDAQDLKKDQNEALERYLSSPSDSAVLVLIAAGRSKLEAAVRAVGEVIGVETPKGRKLVTWIRGRAKDHRVALDDRAAWALIDTVGQDLRELDTALSQLATRLGGGAKVGAAEVKEMFARLADERIYAFTDGVGDRRLAVAMTALRRLLEQGEEPLVVLGALAGHVRRMLRAHRFASGGAKAVGDALGMPGWRAERLTKQVRSYREEELVDALQIVAATDLELKGGDIPAEAALERAVVAIVGGTGRALF